MKILMKKVTFLFWVFGFIGLFLPLQIHTLKAPFRPSDVLPVLPRQVSWPILNYLNGAADLLPSFVGAALPTNITLEWKGACFYQNTAWLEFHNKSGSEFGGGTLHLKVYFFSFFWVEIFSLFWGSDVPCPADLLVLCIFISRVSSFNLVLEA